MQPDLKTKEKMLAPIYVAAFGAAMMALISLPTVTGLNGYSILMIFLLCLGFGMSWLEKTGVIQRSLRLIAVCAFIAITIMIIAGTTGISRFITDLYQVGPNDPIWGCLLAWIVVAFSFNLKSTQRILFLCVPALSMIGVVATVDPTAGVAVCFVGFIAFACFVLIRENAMDEAVTMPKGVLVRPERREPLRWHINLSTGIVLASVLTGLILGSTLLSLVERYGGRPFSPAGGGGFSGGFMGQRYQEVATGSTSQNEQEVMTVTSPEGLLWRGQTYDRYTGRGWEISDYFRQQGVKITPYEIAMRSALKIWQGKLLAYRLPAYTVAENIRSIRSVRQVFEVKKLRYFVLFAAAEPRVVQCDRLIEITENDGSLETHRSYGADMPYRVISDVSSATPDELRNATNEYPKRITEKYLTTPESTWAVRALARRITAHARNNYDKAMAIQDYLTENCTYDLNAPATPMGEDAVDNFIFKSKKGYCDIFSTSMAIMCREVGIPSRWVTGFATGEYDGSDQKYHVKLKDQHAWVELYFPRYGWITFDPTSGTRESNIVSQLRQTVKHVKLYITGAGAAVPVGILAFALMAYIAKTEIADRIRSRRRSSRNGSAQWAAYAEIYNRMCALLAKFGFERRASVTPSEFADDLTRCLSPQLEHISEKVSAITANFEEARYSSRKLPEDRLQSDRETLSVLFRELKTARKENLLPSFCRK
jgi:transglutaminase-like putative cysteine protease